MPPTVTGECQSVRGTWGEICPDCHQRLPTARPMDFGRPCSKTALERGYGWDGRTLDQLDASQMRPGGTRPTPGQGIRVVPREPVGGWDTQL